MLFDKLLICLKVFTDLDMGPKPWKELIDVFLSKTDALRAVCLAVFKYNSCISEQTENFEKFPS